MTRVGNTNNYSPFVKEPLFKETNVCEQSFHASDKASRDLLVFYTNCDQLINKFDELLTIVDNVKPDLILLTEVIPKAQILPIGLPSISIPGFLLFTNFDPNLSHLGKSGYRGLQLAVYVADYLQPTQVTYHSTFKEHLWTSISLNNKDNLLIGNIYRSPSSDKFTSTKELCELINCVNNTKPSHLLIVGDFNYPNIDWNRGCLTREDYSEQFFFDTIQDCVLFQLVTQPTRFRPGTEPHTLDLVLTNEEGMIHNMKYTAGLGNSDHICIQFGLVYTATKMIHKNMGYNYYKADFNKMRDMLDEIDWDIHLKDLNVFETWDSITKSLNYCIETCVPQIKHPPNKRHKYLNRKAIKLRHEKVAAWRRYRATRNHLDYLRFANKRNSLRSLTRSLCFNFEQSLVDNLKTNPKGFWSYINSKIKVKTGIASLTTSNGDSATTPLQKSKLLNSYFSSVFTSECLETLPGMGDFNYEEPLNVVNVTKDTVFNKLKNLKSSKSAGPDGLHPRVLREAAAQLCVPLTILFKRSLDEGLLREDWKRANVIPIFKKGEISDPGNYQPISLTSAV